MSLQLKKSYIKSDSHYSGEKKQDLNPGLPYFIACVVAVLYYFSLKKITSESHAKQFVSYTDVVGVLWAAAPASAVGLFPPGSLEKAAPCLSYKLSPFVSKFTLTLTERHNKGLFKWSHLCS